MLIWNLLHDKQAQRMVETMAEAFEVTFKITEQAKKKEEVHV